MSRSLWKGPFSDLKIIKLESLRYGDKIGVAPQRKLWKEKFTTNGSRLATRIKHKKPTIIHVWSRRSQILPAHLDNKFLVHNGRTFINVKCTQSMCSRKFGEFAVTRKKPSHKLNKRKQLHKNAR